MASRFISRIRIENSPGLIEKDAEKTNIEHLAPIRAPSNIPILRKERIRYVKEDVNENSLYRKLSIYDRGNDF